MRPTILQNQGYTQAPSRLPKVGALVSASPVALTPSDSSFRKLDQLKSALSVFTQGAQSAANTYEQRYMESEQQKALQDFSSDPTSQPAEDSSVYYYKARMGMFGESKGMDIAAATSAEAQRLIDNPDELYDLDVRQHMTDFVNKQFAGLEDPIALGKVLGYANRAQSDSINSLMDNKRKVIDTRNLEATRETVYKAFSSMPVEQLATWLPQNFQEAGSLIDARKYTDVILEAARGKVAEARSRYDPETGALVSSGATEAQGYLDLLNLPVPGQKDSTFASLAFKMDPNAGKIISSLQNHVSTLAAQEAGMEADARNQAIARQQAETEEQLKVLELQLDGEADRAKTPEDIAKALAQTQAAPLDPVRRERLLQKLQTNLIKDMQLAGTKVGEAYTGGASKVYAERAVGNLNNLANTIQDRQEYKQAFATQQEDLKRMAPQHHADANADFFKGTESSYFETMPDGTVALSTFGRSRIDAFETIQDRADYQVGIPEGTRRMLRMVSSLKASGSSEQEALRIAMERLGSNTKPLDINRMAAIQGKLLKDYETPWFGINLSDKDPGIREFFNNLTRSKLSAYSDDGLPDSAIMDEVKTQVAEEVLKVSTPWSSDSGGFIHLSGGDIRLTDDANAPARPVKEFRSYIETAATAILKEASEKYQGTNAVFTPSRTRKGMQELHLQGASTGVYVSNEELARLGASIQKDELELVTKTAGQLTGSSATRHLRGALNSIGIQSLTPAQQELVKKFVNTVDLTKSLIEVDRPFKNTVSKPANIPELPTGTQAQQLYIPPPPPNKLPSASDRLTALQKSALKANAR